MQASYFAVIFFVNFDTDLNISNYKILTLIKKKMIAFIIHGLICLKEDFDGFGASKLLLFISLF